MSKPYRRAREIAHLLPLAAELCGDPDVCHDNQSARFYHLARVAALAAGHLGEARRMELGHWSRHPQRLRNLQRALTAEISAYRTRAMSGTHFVNSRISQLLDPAN